MKTRVLWVIIIGLAVCVPTLQAEKLACVGDSITYGSGIANRAIDAYPPQLEVMLRETFPQVEVRNFGVSGATLLRHGDKPYGQQSAYSQARQWLPDKVIIMLGTNDSKPQNWAYSHQYVSDYLTFIDSFANLDSHPEIWICKPVPAFQLQWGITDAIIRDEIGPMIDEIATQRDVHVVDLYTPMIDTSAFFPDGIHPDAIGSGLMAEILSTYVIGTRRIPDVNTDGCINMIDFATLAQWYHVDAPNLNDPLDLSPVPDGDGLPINGRDLKALFRYWIKRPGLLAHWNLDESEGILAEDTESLIPSTVYGDARWRPESGRNAGALELDGSTTYIETPLFWIPRMALSRSCYGLREVNREKLSSPRSMAKPGLGWLLKPGPS